MFKKSMSPNRTANVQSDAAKTPPATTMPTETPVAAPSSPVPAVEAPAKS